jgi:hypothetical protein
MRMPLFSYFVVMGFTLTLALLILSSRIEPHGSPIPTSQVVGVVKPFKPEPEPSPYRITATNFAAEYRRAPPAYAEATYAAKTVRAAYPSRKRTSSSDTERGKRRWQRIAVNPIAAMMSIH